MRLIRASSIVVVSVHLFVAVAAGQGLDRNAQRFVNDATRDLKSKDIQKRVDAIDHLATWGKLTAAPLIIGALKDPDARVRAAAADALWDDDMKTEAARAPLTAALNDPAPEVAVLAAGALRVLGLSRADVQQANERGLSSSSDPRIRFLAARALIGTGPPARLVSALLQYLERQAAGDARANVELAEHALEELRDTRDRTILAPLTAAIPNMTRGAHIVLDVLGAVQPRPDGWTALLTSQAVRGDADVRRTSLLLMRDLKARRRRGRVGANRRTPPGVGLGRRRPQLRRRCPRVCRWRRPCARRRGLVGRTARSVGLGPRLGIRCLDRHHRPHRHRADERESRDGEDRAAGGSSRHRCRSRHGCQRKRHRDTRRAGAGRRSVGVAPRRARGQDVAP